jgi:hypothetical protein
MPAISSHAERAYRPTQSVHIVPTGRLRVVPALCVGTIPRGEDAHLSRPRSEGEQWPC